ncbi:MAG: PAS domain S-box protein, partial [Burkholderiales bacterium]|nr:PAS domain S-box protein [Burkholderiales bacterium]
AGLLLLSLAFYALILRNHSRLQQLVQLTYQDMTVWRGVATRFNYLIHPPLNERIALPGVQHVQTQFGEALKRDEQLNQDAARLVHSPMTRAWISLMASSAERAAIDSPGVDPQTRAFVRRIALAPSEIVTSVFPSMSASASIALESGSVLEPLERKVDAAFSLQARSLMASWIFGLGASVLIVAAILVSWLRFVAPGFASIQLALGRERREQRLRLEAQDRLASRDTELRLVADNIPALVASCGRDGRLISANRPFFRAFGLAQPATSLGQAMAELVGQTPWAVLQPWFERAARGELVNFDDSLKFPQGLRHVHVTCVPEVNASGVPERVFLFIVDLEERIRAEQALRRSEELFHSAMNSIGEGLLITDSRDLVVQINPVAQALTGWTAAEAQGQPFDRVFNCRESSGPSGEARPQPAINRLGAAWPARLTLESRTGQACPVKGSSAPIVAADGGSFGTVVVFRDITRDNQIQAELQRRDSMQMVGQLAGGIAHDFNNLLASIQGAVSLLDFAESPPPTDSARRNLSIIRMAARSAVDLIKRLTDFGSNRSTGFAPVDLHSVVEEAVAILRHTASRAVRISLSVEPGRWVVLGNAAALQSVVMNLAVNACHAMPEGGELRIECRQVEVDATGSPGPSGSLRPGPYVELSIQDTGTGIPEQDLPRIFQPYFTTKERGKGSGLGLASAWAAVREHEGWMLALSREGIGTTMRVLLPQLPECPSPAAPAAALQRGAAQGLVMLVDDNALLLEVGSNMLLELGCSVVRAENGSQALEHYRALDAPLQAAIIDSSMPVMGGLATVRALRELGATCPMYIASGYFEPGTLEAIRSLPDCRVLQKPYSIQALIQALNRPLSGRSEQAPAPSA